MMLQRVLIHKTCKNIQTLSWWLWRQRPTDPPTHSSSKRNLQVAVEKSKKADQSCKKILLIESILHLLCQVKHPHIWRFTFKPWDIHFRWMDTLQELSGALVIRVREENAELTLVWLLNAKRPPTQCADDPHSPFPYDPRSFESSSFSSVRQKCIQRAIHFSNSFNIFTPLERLSP